MSTLPEQFSEARKSQVAAQLELFRSFSSKAVESAEQIVALNLSTSRASVEKSADTLRQLFSAKDPRDLLALTTQTQENFESFLAYGRALFSIALRAPLTPPSAAAPALSLAPPPAAPAPDPVPVQTPPVAQLHAVPAAEAALTASPAPAVAPSLLAEPAAEPVPELTEALPESVKAKPIAKAVSKVVAPEPLDTPAAAPIAPAKPRTVAVTGIKPVDAEPPPAPVSGKPAALAKQAESTHPKGGKKK